MQQFRASPTDIRGDPLPQFIRRGRSGQEFLEVAQNCPLNGKSIILETHPLQLVDAAAPAPTFYSPLGIYERTPRQVLQHNTEREREREREKLRQPIFCYAWEGRLYVVGRGEKRRWTRGAVAQNWQDNTLPATSWPLSIRTTRSCGPVSHCGPTL